MTHLYPWPSRFLNIGRKTLEPDPKPKNNKARRHARKKMNRLGARSSSRMIKMINQKISVVKSDILIAKKFNGTSSSLDMFTPIVTSFNTVPHQFISRYPKPRVMKLGRSPKKNYTLDNYIKSKHTPMKNMKPYASVGKIEYKKLLSTKTPRQLKENSNKALRATKRPCSEPTKFKYSTKPVEEINVNQRVMKGATSAMKPVGYSETLFDMEMKFRSSSTNHKQRRNRKKTNKKQVNSAICVEGLQDTFSLNCDSGLMQDLNPQLFGSLTSTSSYPPNFRGKPICKNADKPSNFSKMFAPNKRGENFTKKKNSKVKNVDHRVQHFISEIPEQSLTRLKRKKMLSLPSKHVLTRSSSYSKNRNLFCETNVILEENLEIEDIDGERDVEDGSNMDNNSRDLSKQNDEEIKQKLLSMLTEKKRSKNCRRKNVLISAKKEQILKEMGGKIKNSSSRKKFLSLLNSENSSTSSRPCDRKKKRTKIVHYIDENFRSEYVGASANSVPRRSGKLKNEKLNQDIDLEDLLLELLVRNGSNNENYYKQFHKALRRSFFTVPKDNSSLYETCRSHLSGDDLLMEDLSNGSKPPPPTPNNEELCAEDKESPDSKTQVEKNISSFRFTEENSNASSVNPRSDNTSMCKGLASDLLGESATLSKISGRMSTEEKSAVIQPSQTEQDKKKMKHGKNNYLEHLREIDESKCSTGAKNMISFHHKVEKIPSISDTYIYESFPYVGLYNKKNSNGRTLQVNTSKDIDPSIEELKLSDRRKQSRSSRWKSAPALSGQSNFETCYSIELNKMKIDRKRSNNVSSTFNNCDSISSNMEIFGEKGNDTVVNPQSIFSNPSGKLHTDKSWYYSDISSLSSSPIELHEDSSTLESIVKCLNGVGCRSSDDITLTDVLKDFSELDHNDILKRIMSKSNEENSSLETSKKELNTRTSEKIVKPIEKGDFIRISHSQMYSPKAEQRSLEPKICSTDFLKSPSESNRPSHESFPDRMPKMEKK